jgi:hypothetical protein
MISRKCPRCGRNITYKNDARAAYAEEKGTLCKGCNTRAVQTTWSLEKRELATSRMLATKASWSVDEKHAYAERQRYLQKAVWKTLPDAYVKATLENPEWHAKLSASHRKPCSDVRRQAIIEGKVGMTYNAWLLTKPQIEAYQMAVRFQTNKQPLETLPNYELRGYRSYHLDHKYSVIAGFRNGVSPEVIGHIVNLQYIPMKENLAKRDKCSLTLDELMSTYSDFLAHTKP